MARFGSANNWSNMPDPRVLGIDIGGANIKASTVAGESEAVRFALWREPDRLTEQLVAIANRRVPCDAWAVTMTGEMADCFPCRATGVRSLVASTRRAAEVVGVSDLTFYRVDGRFVSADSAAREPLPIASANWHALAAWVASLVDSPALLIDVGGTTTDIIPLESGTGPGDRGVATACRTDFDRLVAGQLVYLGGERTPVCAVVEALPYGDGDVPVMREVFANLDDCALVLGLGQEHPDDRESCDGQPRTAADATSRLARMIGLDGRDLDPATAHRMARAVITAASRALIRGIAAQSARHAGRWVLSGHAADYFLPDLRAAFPGARVERLSERIGLAGSRVAPALACAKLRAAELASAVIAPPGFQDAAEEKTR